MQRANQLLQRRSNTTMQSPPNPRLLLRSPSAKHPILIKPRNPNRSLITRLHLLRLPRRLLLYLNTRHPHRNQRLLRLLLHLHISPHRLQRTQRLQQTHQNLRRPPLSLRVLPLMLRLVTLLQILLRQRRPAPAGLDFAPVFPILLTMRTTVANQRRRSQMISK